MKPLYDPQNGQMRVVGFMSGSGTNLTKILEFERSMDSSPYKIVGILTDDPDSNAGNIASRFGIPCLVNNFDFFCITEKITDLCSKMGITKPRKSMEVRELFDSRTLEIIKPLEATVAAYGGYMLIASPILANSVLGVNVHPADLSITSGEGKRKYKGDHAVRDAILAGEDYIRSSTHLIEEEVDGGRILMISDSVRVQLPINFDPENRNLVNQVARAHQELLKINGDWVIFPQTLSYIAEGRFAEEEGTLFFEGEPVPGGVKFLQNDTK